MEKKYEDALYNVCSKLLCGQIKNEFHILGIMLTGSFVIGNNHKYSDLDLYVFHNGDNARDLNYEEKSIPVHIRFQPIEYFTNTVTKQDRCRPAYLTCRVIYDECGILDSYLEKSKELISKGPLPLTKDEKDALAAMLKNEPKTALGLFLKGEIAAAALLVNEVLLKAMSLYNDKHGMWMANNNYIFKNLKLSNKELGNLAEQIALENNVKKKIEDLDTFCQAVLNEVLNEVFNDGDKN